MSETTPETTEATPAVASADETLAGYFETHDRPPAFEGPDGHPYTVSREVEKTGDLRAPYHAYLVFPRWAATGLGIVGHVETPTLAECQSEEEARERLGALTLMDVKELLDAAVAGREDEPATS